VREREREREREGERETGSFIYKQEQSLHVDKVKYDSV